MNYIIELGEHFTTTANEKYGEPPYGHAEFSSLKMFCNRMNIELAQAIELLKKAGVTIKGAEQPIGELLKNNNLTPQQLYNIIKNAEIIPKGESSKFPESPSPGFGQKTIKDICQAYNLPMPEVLAALKKAGFTVQPDDIIKNISINNNSNPMIIFEIIKEVAK